MRDDLELARLVCQLADDLDARLYAHTGPIRQIARRVVELTPEDQPAHRCGLCGVEVVQPAGGGLRKWCSSSCRKKAERARVRNVSASETMPEP